MTDPFENDGTHHLVLMNDDGQYSLWPEPIDVPSGWRVVFGPGARQECLEYVEANWVVGMPASPADHKAMP